MRHSSSTNTRPPASSMPGTIRPSGPRELWQMPQKATVSTKKRPRSSSSSCADAALAAEETPTNNAQSAIVMVIIAVIRLAMCGQGRFTGKIVHTIEQQWGDDLIVQFACFVLDCGAFARIVQIPPDFGPTFEISLAFYPERGRFAGITQGSSDV